MPATRGSVPRTICSTHYMNGSEREKQASHINPAARSELNRPPPPSSYAHKLNVISLSA